MSARISGHCEILISDPASQAQSSRRQIRSLETLSGKAAGVVHTTHQFQTYLGLKCVVTGGASFIGSHLTEALLLNGAQVVVLDDHSSGMRANLEGIEGQLTIHTVDVGTSQDLDRALQDADVVFHLAAIHGGRGFIDTHADLTLRNLALDWTVFSKAQTAGVPRVVHASSACAYPVTLQSDSSSRLLLTEDLAGFDVQGKAFPDGAYGWGKLMGEYQLATMCENSAMTGRSARIFTAYGSRENESHAMVALVAKALLKLDPFPIWGDGQQTRNFTHVTDIVKGLLLLGCDARPMSFDVFNLGTPSHHSILEVLDVIFEIVGWQPELIDTQLSMPVGVRSRAASTSKLLNTFDWEPRMSLHEGISELVSWYAKVRFPGLDHAKLESRLISR